MKAGLVRIGAIAPVSALCVSAVGAESFEPQRNGMFEEIVVTAARGEKSRMRSATSVTHIGQDRIADFAPRSEAEILHLIPGIRVEATAGPGGNSNITVRGLPLAAGGAKYVQLQEDGLPVVEYGDIAFGNNDYWLRNDWTVANVQATRGGSALTFASQAPGAVINFISRTGEEKGGRVGLSTGLGYEEKRLDFVYGGPIGAGTRFNAGGFYRRGAGPRDAPYRAQDGYQIKANLTQELADGKAYIRLNLKRLHDRAPTYTSAPFAVRLEGDTVTGYAPLPGFDARKDTNFSRYNIHFPTVEPDGRIVTGSNRDGINVEVTTLGTEFRYMLGDAITIDNRFKYSWMKGDFSAPFLGDLANVAALTEGAGAYRVVANGTTYVAATARYANGPLAGSTVPGSAVVNRFPNLFTEMTDFDHLANDLGITGKFALAAGTVTARLGYYHSRQDIAMNWHWNDSINAVTGDNPARIDLYAADGTRLTDDGVTGYNNQWGACCARSYDLRYTGDAPYFSVSYDDDRLGLDASVRLDRVSASGIFRGTAPTPVSIDVDGDGALSVAEQNVYLAKGAAPQHIDYAIRYRSWSLGGSFRLSPDASLFLRLSRGYRANADRVVSDATGAFNADGSLTRVGEAIVLNPVTQQELGLKQRGEASGGSYGLLLTLFRAQTAEYNFDLTEQRQIFAKYKSWGAEIETMLRAGAFGLAANLVYTNARIAEDLISGNGGNRPRATPAFMWLVAPTYDFGRGAIGFTLRGQSASYPQDSNEIRMRGFSTVNAFVRIVPMEGVTLALNANNIFNVWDMAGRLDQSSVGGVQALGALFGVPAAATNRVGLGRTVSATISYAF